MREPVFTILSILNITVEKVLTVLNRHLGVESERLVTGLFGEEEVGTCEGEEPRDNERFLTLLLTRLVF